MYSPKHLKKIVKFGEEYRRTHLIEKHDKATLETDWWQAIIFFFGRAFYQGRKDKVSMLVQERATEVLNSFFHNSKKDIEFEIMMNENWKPIEEELKKVIGKGKIGKGADIVMTIDSLQFISMLPKKNIVTYSLKEIKEGKLNKIYRSLQKRHSKDGIHSVGPKIASFYLRDLVSLFDYDKYINEDDLILLQPIDTWVRQVAFEIGLINNKNQNDKEVRDIIVSESNKHGLSPVKFNQGAWFLGYNSFKIALRNIDDIKQIRL